MLITTILHIIKLAPLATVAITVTEEDGVRKANGDGIVPVKNKKQNFKFEDHAVII